MRHIGQILCEGVLDLQLHPAVPESAPQQSGVSHFYTHRSCLQPPDRVGENDNKDKDEIYKALITVQFPETPS